MRRPLALAACLLASAASAQVGHRVAACLDANRNEVPCGQAQPSAASGGEAPASPAVGQFGGAIGAAVGAAFGAGMVAPIDPIKGHYGTMQGQRFNEKYDDGSSEANSAGVSSARGLVDDYVQDCASAVCLQGSTPSFAELGEREKARERASLAELPADDARAAIKNPYSRRTAAAKVRAVMDKAAADEAYTAEKFERDTKLADLAATGVAFVTGKDIGWVVDTAHFVAQGGEVADEVDKLAHGDLTGVGIKLVKAGVNPTLATGVMEFLPEVEGAEPHALYHRIVEAQLSAAETGIQKGLDQIQSEFDIPKLKVGPGRDEGE